VNWARAVSLRQRGAKGIMNFEFSILNWAQAAILRQRGEIHIYTSTLWTNSDYCPKKIK